VLLRLEGEGIAVDTRVRVSGVVPRGLDLVEVLARLLLEAILAVEDELELVERTGGLYNVAVGRDAGNRLLDPLARGHVCVRACDVAVQGTRLATDIADGATGERVEHNGVTCVCGTSAEEVEGVGLEDDCASLGSVGGEVPVHVVLVDAVVVAPHELLDGVVVGEADLGGGTARGGTGIDGISTSVLHLLDEVLVTLLGEAAALLSVEVDVVAPHTDVRGEVVAEIGRQVEIKANLVVLEGDQGEVQTGIAVEEEDEGKEDLVAVVRARAWVCARVGGHLVVLGLLVGAEEQLSVQAPPELVVLVNALAADRQLNVLDSALSSPNTSVETGTGS